MIEHFQVRVILEPFGWDLRLRPLTRLRHCGG